MRPGKGLSCEKYNIRACGTSSFIYPFTALKVRFILAVFSSNEWEIKRFRFVLATQKALLMLVWKIEPRIRRT